MPVAACCAGYKEAEAVLASLVPLEGLFRLVFHLLIPAPFPLSLPLFFFFLFPFFLSSTKAQRHQKKIAVAPIQAWKVISL